MALTGLFADFVMPGHGGNVFALVALARGHVADGAVSAFMVVPLHVLGAPGPGSLQRLTALGGEPRTLHVRPDPFLTRPLPYMHIVNTVLELASFCTTLKRHFIQRQPSGRMPGNQAPRQGALARSSVSKKYGFHCAIGSLV